MKMREFESIQQLPPNAVIVATFSPGFSTNLSSWRLVIDENGNLFQNTAVWEWTAEAGIVTERRDERIYIGVNEVARLLERARAIINQPLPPPSMEMMTDTPSLVLLARLGEEFQNVPSDAEDFWELWKEIHLHAPYSPQT